MQTVTRENVEVVGANVDINGNPSAEAILAQRLAAIAQLTQQCRSQIGELGRGNAPSVEGNDAGEAAVNDGSIASVDTSFEEPEARDLENALTDLKGRVGLSEQEYAEEYCLRNVAVNFAAFEERLKNAPTVKRVRIVEAYLREDHLVLFCQKEDSGEFGLMNPRQVDKELVNREFNAWGAKLNGRDPEKSQVNILRARGMEHATKSDALHVSAFAADGCEGVSFLNLAPRENMTSVELDYAQRAALFFRECCRTSVYGNLASYHNPLQGGLGVLWV